MFLYDKAINLASIPMKRSAFYRFSVFLGLLLGAAVLWFFLSAPGSLGLYRWRPDYRLYFWIPVFAAIFPAFLALVRFLICGKKQACTPWLKVVIYILVFAGIVGNLFFGGYYFVVSRRLSADTPPVLMITARTGVHQVPDLALVFRTGEKTSNTLSLFLGEEKLTYSEPEPVRQHAIPLKDLRPGCFYRWQLNGGAMNYFYTPLVKPSADSVLIYRFAAAGDAHVGENLRGADSNLMSGDTAVFGDILRWVSGSGKNFNSFFILGDLVHEGTRDDAWQTALNMLARPSYRVPVRPLFGNHDALINGHYHFAQYLYPSKLPQSGRTPFYYRIDAGITHFIILNLLWSTTETFDRAQQEWFCNQMDSIPDDHWTVVMMHSMVFSSGDTELGLPWYDPPQAVQKMAPLFEKYDVDLVMGGHNHLLEFLQHNGVSYIVAGGLGGNLTHARYISPASLWHNDNEHGFADVMVYRSRMVVYFRNRQGKILQTFTIRQNHQSAQRVL